jgi:hypothetical protein
MVRNGCADIGALEIREARLFDRAWQLHAAQLVILAGRHQSRFAKCLQSSLDFGNDMDRLAVEMRLLLVVFLVMRRKQVARNLFACIERGIEGFAGMVGVTLARRQRFDVQPFIEQEFEITAGEDFGLHYVVR